MFPQRETRGAASSVGGNGHVPEIGVLAATELRRDVERCFLDDRGPGRLPDPGGAPDGDHVRGLLAPYGPLDDVGPVAARAFLHLATQPRPDCLLLLATADGNQVLLPEADQWSTPLGALALDTEVTAAAGRLCRARNVPLEPVFADSGIAAQLPFIQCVYDSPPPIAPLLAPATDETALRRLVSGVVRALAGREFVVIAASNLGRGLAGRELERHDKRWLHHILELNPAAVMECSAAMSTTAGDAAVAVTLLLLCRLYGEHCAELVGYDAVTDADTQTANGYGAIVVQSLARRAPA